jgi:hypothetical protein
MNRCNPHNGTPKLISAGTDELVHSTETDYANPLALLVLFVRIGHRDLKDFANGHWSFWI